MTEAEREFINGALAMRELIEQGLEKWCSGFLDSQYAVSFAGIIRNSWDDKWGAIIKTTKGNNDNCDNPMQLW